MPLNLTAFTEGFIRTQLPSFDKEAESDKIVVQAVSDSGLASADRQKHLLDWLNRYHALFCFSQQKRENVSSKIIHFADEYRSEGGLLKKQDIITRYNELMERIQTEAPVNPKTQKKRQVASLTSKALWCCYPHDIPMFDEYACRALQVISRLAEIEPAASEQGYAIFIDVWFKVYEQVRSVIEGAELTEHPYKVRVFDRLLWHLGQPHF